MTTYILNSSDEDYYRNFKNSIKSNDTFKTYDYKLKMFMKYKGITPGEYSQLIDGKDLKIIEADVIDFIVFLKENHYTSSSQKSYLNALMHFYSINDVALRRKKISKFLSNDDAVITDDNYNNSNNNNNDSGNGDKPYTREQIARLIEFADIRARVIILIMASAGLRLGALPFESWKFNSCTKV